jgi:hypothetical protein
MDVNTVTCAVVSGYSAAKETNTAIPPYKLVIMAVAQTKPMPPGNPTISIKGPKMMARYEYGEANPRGLQQKSFADGKKVLH